MLRCFFLVGVLIMECQGISLYFKVVGHVRMSNYKGAMSGLHATTEMCSDYRKSSDPSRADGHGIDVHRISSFVYAPDWCVY